MAAYALARIQYKPKVGSILMFVVLLVAATIVTVAAGLDWRLVFAAALAIFFLLLRALSKHFTKHMTNNDILFWVISQRILPPIVVIIPIYMMFSKICVLCTC